METIYGVCLPGKNREDDDNKLSQLSLLNFSFAYRFYVTSCLKNKTLI